MVNLRHMKMGRVEVDVELVNNNDLVRFQAGDIPAEQVRRLPVHGLVDTGASRLVLPKSVAERLGLQMNGTVAVRYADGRRRKRPLAMGINLTLAGRSSVFSAVVEPRRDSALIGAIVLEELDLIPDCTRQALVPRDPERIISEIE